MALELYSELASEIRALPQQRPTSIVGVDGAGGSGKTWFASRLANALESVPVVHTDEFASWEEPINWDGRFREQVLDPLLRGQPARYPTYDWERQRLGDWREVPAGGVVLLEGVTAIRDAWGDKLAFRIWVECPREVRLSRGLERDGEQAEPLWEKWMAAEDEFIAKDQPAERADIVVDGNPHEPHDPETGYVRLR